MFNNYLDEKKKCVQKSTYDWFSIFIQLNPVGFLTLACLCRYWTWVVFLLIKQPTRKSSSLLKWSKGAQITIRFEVPQSMTYSMYRWRIKVRPFNREPLFYPLDQSFCMLHPSKSFSFLGYLNRNYLNCNIFFSWTLKSLSPLSLICRIVVTFNKMRVFQSTSASSHSRIAI